jgi:hypothetical protein
MTSTDRFFGGLLDVVLSITSDFLASYYISTSCTGYFATEKEETIPIEFGSPVIQLKKQ